MLRVGLVIALDVLEIVEVVHHQAVRLPHCPFRNIGQEIEPFEASAVAEMKPGDRVDRRAGGRASMQIVPRRRAEERFANALSGRRIAPPIRLIERGKRGTIFPAERRCGRGTFALEPFGEFRRRR